MEKGQYGVALAPETAKPVAVFDCFGDAMAMKARLLAIGWPSNDIILLKRLENGAIVRLKG